MTAQPKRRPINATQAPSSSNEEALAQKKTIPSGVESSIENTELKEVNEPVSIAPEFPAVSDNPEAKDENPVMLPESDEEWEKKIAEAKKNVEQKKETPVLHEPSSALAPQKDRTPITEPAVDIEAEIERRVAERLAAEQKKNEVKEQPKVEEKTASVNAEELEQKHAAIAKKNNASGLIFVNLGNDDDFDAAIAREFDEDERPEGEKTRNPTDYAQGMSLIRELGQRTAQQKLLKEWITHLFEKNPNALKAVEDRLRVNKIIPKIGDGSGPKKLSGAAAKAAVISRMKGMYRIQLYNSGFWIDICPPSLVDIDNWMQEVDQEFKELGRCLGGHAHTCLDVFLKKKLCDILPGLIQRSNYENWEDKPALMKNISFHDYDTILWGLCCSMYRDGIGIGVYCTNPDCRHVDTSQYLDVAKLCYINTEKFPAQALEWMTSKAYNAAQLLSDEDLANYRDKLLGFTKTISVDGGASVYELGVPLLVDFIDRGANLVGKITAITNGEKSVQSDELANQMTFHLYKMLLPWIKSLSMNDSDGNLVFKIEDRDAIYESLDINTFGDDNFYQSVVEFIENTKLTYFAANTLKCPKCGKAAELDKENMFPIDLQYVFFGLCCLQMNQNGASF